MAEMAIRYESVIRLPNGRVCTLRTYVESWRKLKMMPVGKDVTGFDHFAMPVSRILRKLRFGMHDRINRHIPGHGSGRKWSDDWQRAARHCANEVNRPRLIVRWVPHDLRKRLAHRIYQEA